MITQAALDRALDASLPHAEGSDGRCLGDFRPWPCPRVAVATDRLPNLTLMPGVVIDTGAVKGVIARAHTRPIRQRAVAAISRSMELNGERCVLSVDIDPSSRLTRLLRIDTIDNARAAEAALRRVGYAVEWVADGDYEPVLRVGPTELAVA